MSLRSQLTSAASALQAAVEREDFAGAAACAIDYQELLQRAIRDLPADEAAEQVDAGSRRLEWARRKICVARARMSERVRTLVRAARYRTPAGKAVHTWTVQA